VVTASWDQTARVFEASGGKELARVEHGGRVNSAAFSPDGAFIITGSSDRSVRLWRVWQTQQHLVNSAVSRAPQCLTPAQRRQYFLTPVPPLWCLERKLTPYHRAEWQEWLPKRKSWLASGRPTGLEPSLPKVK
jgi:WD domain, G-beta repeat